MAIIDALYTVTTLDPACGSGAFPIGVLQKIVYILQVIDPDAKMWLSKTITSVDILFRTEIEKKFSTGQLNYIRKLYVLKNSIFGIDIQPIAVEISRLRCFLSLIIEEKVDDAEDNRGIKALPNLDFKFIIANSLISLDESTQITTFEDLSHIDKLKLVREEYFNADDNRKSELRLDFTQIQQDMLLNTLNNYLKIANKKYTQLFSWKPFSNESTSWFDPDWMFGIKDGFDIVIGNPPYGLLNKKQNQKSSICVSEEVLKCYKTNAEFYPAKGGVINIYRLFICKSHQFLKKDGHLSLIFPMAFMGDLSAYELRKHILNNETIKYIEAFPERDDENKRVFQSAKMSVCILGSNKTIPLNDYYFKLRINDDRFVNMSYKQIYISPSYIKTIDQHSLAIPLVNQEELNLMLKICSGKKRMADISKCYTGEIDLSLDKKYITLDSTYHAMLRGAQIQRFFITNNISQGDILYLDSKRYLNEVTSPKSKHYSKQRIVMQGITGVNEKYRLKMTKIDAGYFCANSVNYLLIDENIEYYLGICNSHLINWFFKKLSTNSNVNGYEVDNLPIATADESLTLKIKQIVSSLLYSNNIDGSSFNLEKELNEIVYSLYGLSSEEIVIVESSFC